MFCTIFISFIWNWRSHCLSMQGLMSSSHNVTERRVVCVCTCSTRFVQELYTFEIHLRQLVKHGRANFSSLYSLCNWKLRNIWHSTVTQLAYHAWLQSVHKHWIPVHSLSLSGNVPRSTYTYSCTYAPTLRLFSASHKIYLSLMHMSNQWTVLQFLTKHRPVPVCVNKDEADV